jgi:hypothetical protein
MKSTLKKLRQLLQIPLYSNKKLLLAFEYGLMLSETAKGMKVKLTPEIVARLETIIQKEFVKKSPTKLAVDMTVNILASYETK